MNFEEIKQTCNPDASALVEDLQQLTGIEKIDEVPMYDVISAADSFRPHEKQAEFPARHLLYGLSQKNAHEIDLAVPRCLSDSHFSGLPQWVQAHGENLRDALTGIYLFNEKGLMDFSSTLDLGKTDGIASHDFPTKATLATHGLWDSLAALPNHSEFKTALNFVVKLVGHNNFIRHYDYELAAKLISTMDSLNTVLIHNFDPDDKTCLRHDWAGVNIAAALSPDDDKFRGYADFIEKHKAPYKALSDAKHDWSWVKSELDANRFLSGVGYFYGTDFNWGELDRAKAVTSTLGNTPSCIVAKEAMLYVVYSLVKEGGAGTYLSDEFEAMFPDQVEAARKRFESDLCICIESALKSDILPPQCVLRWVSLLSPDVQIPQLEKMKRSISLDYKKRQKGIPSDDPTYRACHTALDELNRQTYLKVKPEDRAEVPGLDILLAEALPKD